MGALSTSAPTQHRIHADKVDAISAELPRPLRKTRHAASSAGAPAASPPLRFYATDDRTLVGVRARLRDLVADVLGLKLDVRVADWENLFVGIDCGEVDAVFSNVTVTEERKEKYDFATYRKDNVALEVPTKSTLEGSRRTESWRASGSRSAPAPTRRRSWSSGTSRTPKAGEADRHQLLPADQRLLPGAAIGPPGRPLRTQPQCHLPLDHGEAERDHRRPSPARATGSRARSRRPPRRTTGWSAIQPPLNHLSSTAVRQVLDALGPAHRGSRSLADQPARPAQDRRLTGAD